jgi:hypothetical protein
MGQWGKLHVYPTQMRHSLANRSFSQYQYGKYVPHIGPQTTFPIPPGIINNRGNNAIGLSLWAQTNEGAKFNEIKLITFGLYQTDFGFSRNWQYLQPKWSDRSQYA